MSLISRTLCMSPQKSGLKIKIQKIESHVDERAMITMTFRGKARVPEM